jgi:HK97 family phage major capsid protein
MKLDFERYSLGRALQLLTSRNSRSGYEEEIHRELSRSQKTPITNHSESVLVPLAALARAQNVGSAPAGGFTVGDVVPSISEALRPSSVVLSAGAQVLELAPNVRVPKITSGMALHWLGESEECPESDITYGDVALVPRRCAGWLTISNQLLIQSALADFVIRRDMRSAVASAIDLGALSGVGNAEPIGLLNNPAVPATITFGGAATLDDVTTAEKTVADAGAEMGSEAFISSPATRKKWRAIEKASGNGGFLWDDTDRVIGKRAFATTNVTGDLLAYGAFSDFLVVMFGVVEIMLDRLTGAKSGQTLFHVFLLADCAPLRAASFVRSTDSAAQ